MGEATVKPRKAEVAVTYDELIRRFNPFSKIFPEGAVTAHEHELGQKILARRVTERR